MDPEVNDGLAACLVVIPIMVDSYGFLFNCRTVVTALEWSVKVFYNVNVDCLLKILTTFKEYTVGLGNCDP